MDLVTLSKQVLSQIRPILTCDACDQRLFQWTPPFGFRVSEKEINPETHRQDST